MTSDLLFSILPREGKVPIKTETQKVEKINKSESLKPLTDEEAELHVEEREAQQKQQHKGADEDKDDSTQQELEKKNHETKVDDTEGKKKPKGPKHLDIYV